MSPKTEHIVHDALQLSSEDRAFITNKLLESLDYEEPFEISAEWKKEIERRCQEIDNRRAQLIPGDQVLKDAVARLKR